MPRRPARILAARASILLLAVLAAACQTGPTKEEIEAAKKTIDCQRGDERILIRFDEGEARLLMPDGSRVVLYPVAVASGIRYTNGLIEIRGKGMDLTYIRNGEGSALSCKQYELPKKKEE
jgi:membrane-bound inhibitor of C-type lysozyme